MDWTPLKALVGGNNSNFGLIVASIIIASGLYFTDAGERLVNVESRLGNVESRLVNVESRLGNVEKEIVELRVETKTEIDGLKEDVRRIERKLDDFIASQAASP